MTSEQIHHELELPAACELPGGRLYRYRRFDATELRLLIVAHQVRVSNANFFNDPWDCRPRLAVRQWTNASELTEIIEYLRETTLQLHPEKDPADVQKMAEAFRRDPTLIQPWVSERSEAVLASIRALYPILCLAPAGDTPLMWSHYGDAHKGICLIFNAWDRVIGTETYAVQYEQDYPTIFLPSESDNEALIKSVLTKPVAWKSEAEYRLIARESSGGQSHFPQSTHGFLELPPEAFVGVILGAFMSQSDSLWARELVQASKKPLELWRASLSPGEYALRLNQE